MPEWQTYSLADALLFSPRVYWRLIHLHNEAVWPLHILALLLGAAILKGGVRPSRWTAQAAAAGLAVAWVWVAWSFLWSRYATINWPMVYVAPGFALQGLLLVWFGAVRSRLVLMSSLRIPRVIGLALFSYALLVHPWVAILAGRPIQAAEVVGILPDPTVIATLGLISMAAGARMEWLLLVVPLAWCALSWATLYAMGEPEAWIMVAAAVLAVAARGLAGGTGETRGDRRG
jgi:hypothetical protein